VCRQELESVTSKLQLQVCRACEKAADSLVAVAAAATPTTFDRRDELPQPCRQPRNSLLESNRRRSQHQLEILACSDFMSNLCLTSSPAWLFNVLFNVRETNECRKNLLETENWWSDYVGHTIRIEIARPRL